ncbi:MAG TPA: hypothetical protein DCF45_01975 [Gammaproteobacteria bacterium]|nr:hypothetical protein [Gammaproteobacteria bacterium]
MDNIIDGDGHIIEDELAISEHLLEPFRSAPGRSMDSGCFRRWIPSILKHQLPPRRAPFVPPMPLTEAAFLMISVSKKRFSIQHSALPTGKFIIETGRWPSPATITTGFTMPI